MRTPFVPCSERRGDWNWGNVQSAGGVCLVVEGDELLAGAGHAHTELAAGEKLTKPVIVTMAVNGKEQQVTIEPDQADEASILKNLGMMAGNPTLEGVAVAIRAWLAPSDPALGEQD